MLFRSEIGILRAVGARSKDVFKIFFSESLIIAIINAILANISLFIVVFCINTTLRKNYNLLITILNPGILQSHQPGVHRRRLPPARHGRSRFPHHEHK